MDKQCANLSSNCKFHPNFSLRLLVVKRINTTWTLFENSSRKYGRLHL